MRTQGTPGGEATFAIEGVTGNIAMTERQSGLYVGRYAITAPFVVQDARVFVTLTPATVQVSSSLLLTLLFCVQQSSVPPIPRGAWHSGNPGGPSRVKQRWTPRPPRGVNVSGRLASCGNRVWP